MSGSDWLVACRIDRLRELKGLTLKQFAEAVQMPYRTVQNYLTGDVKVPADFIHKSAAYFKVEIDYLFYAGIDFDRKVLMRTLDDVFGGLVDQLSVSNGTLEIRSGNSAAESPSFAEVRRTSVLLHISAAIRDGYIDRRLDALSSSEWDGVYPADEAKRWRYTHPNHQPEALSEEE